MKIRLALAASAMLLACGFPARGDETADIADARSFAEPILGKHCEFPVSDDAAHIGENSVFQLTYRLKGQDQDSPDQKLVLVQLACSPGAANSTSIFVTRESNGRWQLLSFAEPRVDYDYTDESFSRLKSPPTVTGFGTSTILTNSKFSPETQTLTSLTKWGGAGDAWSAGRWAFEHGAFILKTFEIDPTFRGDGDTDADQPGADSYFVYDASKPAK